MARFRGPFISTRFFRAALLLALSAWLGCSSGGETPSLNEDRLAQRADAHLDEPLNPVRAVDLDLSEEASLALANSDFACDLYRHLRGQPGNLAFSPYNISLGLAMCSSGARGETQKQLRRALRLTLDQSHTAVAWQKLSESIRSDAAEQGVELRSASRLWADQSLHVADEFLRITHEHYGAEFAKLALMQDRAGAAREIDAWINEQTHGKLAGESSSTDLPPDTWLVLACAIYFKADWSFPFWKEATKPAPFYIRDGRTVDADMMHYDDIMGAFRAAVVDDVQILELKYGPPSQRDGDFSMVLLLPSERDDLPALERRLTTERLNQWISELAPGHIEVFLPRFRVGSQVRLAAPLEQMGATSAFSRQQADFTGIGDGEFYLIDVLHAAVVSVDEEGTEAAAATRFLYGAEDDSKPVVFRADHPFIFLIRHDPSGSILFIGRVENPAV